MKIFMLTMIILISSSQAFALTQEEIEENTKLCSIPSPYEGKTQISMDKGRCIQNPKS